jgi:hypothetical protein
LWDVPGFVERIVQQEREAKLRKEAALRVVLALPPSERRQVLAELILHEEAEGDDAPPKQRAVPASPPAPAAAVPGAEGRRGTFTDMAAAYVLAHPEGVKTAEVGKAIGQDVSSVDGSLRQGLRRGTIARKGRLWVPAVTNGASRANGVAKQPEKPRKKTIRDLIEQVFASNGNKPLGVAALYDALTSLKADINRSSVDGEMNRMRLSNLLKQTGTGPNGGGLYKLATEATTRPS